MKFYDFKNAINKPYFNLMDISLRNIQVYPYQLSLWKNQGKIDSLRRGLYCFSEEKNKLQIEHIAFLLYKPSYISLESALSYYGFIPEMVYTKTSITSRTSQKFSNDFGNFTYRHIQQNLFFGYIVQQNENEGKYLLAEPEKALLDYFYFYLGRIEGKDDIEELRMNYYEIEIKINKKKFFEYRSQFKIKKLDYVTDILLELCSLSNK